MSHELPMYLNGKWHKSIQELPVKSPYDRHMVGKTWKAGPDEIEHAIRGAEAAFEITKQLPLYEKAEKLLQTAQAIKDNLEDIAQVLSGEAGKPIKAARAEVS